MVAYGEGEMERGEIGYFLLITLLCVLDDTLGMVGVYGEKFYVLKISWDPCGNSLLFGFLYTVYIYIILMSFASRL